jgi:hypothetical protein
VEKRELHHLPQLLQGVLGPADFVVGDVGLVFHGHEGDGRVDFGGEGDLKEGGREGGRAGREGRREGEK